MKISVTVFGRLRVMRRHSTPKHVTDTDDYYLKSITQCTPAVNLIFPAI